MKIQSRRAVQVFLFLLLTCLTILPSTVPAADKNVIVKNTTTNVPTEQTLQTLVVFNHNAKVEGRVTDVVFVYNGDVQLASSSKTGVVIVLGGHVQQESGAYVEDGVAAITFDNSLLNNSLLALVVVSGLWAARLVSSLLLVIIPVLISIAVRDRMYKPIEFLRVAPLRTGVIGLIILVAGLSISLLLALTLIGAPLTLVFVTVLGILLAAGYTVVSYQVGKLIDGGRSFSTGHWKPTLIGAVAMVAIGNIPLFGGIMLIVVFALSIGIATVWFWKRKSSS